MATRARGDDQALTSAEYRSFKKHFANLSDGIQNPTSLANRMFSADLLSRDTRRRISELPLTEQKVSTLLDVIETMISLDPQNFYKFVVELEKDSPMQHLCDKLRFTCASLAVMMPPTQAPPFSFSSSTSSCKNEAPKLWPKSRIPRLVTPVTIHSLPSTSVLSTFGVPPTARSSLFIKKKSTRSPILQPTLPPNTSAQQFREHDTMLRSSSSSSSSSSHSSTTVTRNHYRVFLKDCYRQPLPDDDKLLTTASKHYIELAVINREDITRKEADEFTTRSLHGLTEEILRKKTPIALKDILKPREDGKPVRCVLVEGAPGIGKSTLSWEVCHKWEELDSVKQYELVVLVRLREKKSQEAHCLEDLLPCVANTNIKELVAAIGRGKGVLIMCDGFDELPHEQRQEGSVYIELLKGRILPEAAIIVTSRPSVSADLWKLCQHNIDRHLEVIGFTKKDIKRFAESVFSGDILKGFLSYITSNPPIYGMMYIPLNAVIVALIYQDSYDTDTPFPTTMTQLFDALTRALIRRHFVSLRNEIHIPSSLRCMEDINKLPPLVAHQLLELARVAYASLHRNRFVFTDLGEDFEDLGMMKKTTSLNVCTGRECSYTFLHLTLQEYMAALYIAIVCPSGLGVEQLTDDSIVVRFLAGICRDDEDHSHCYQELVKLLDSKLELPPLLYGMECSGGCSHSLLDLVHVSYECPSIMQSINAKNIDGNKYLEPVVGFDWYVTGYCISHFNVEWGLSTEHATDEKINLLVKGLWSSSTANGAIQTLHVHLSTNVFQIYRFREFCQLHTLCLQDVTIDEDDEVNLCQLIKNQSRLRRVECHNSVNRVFQYTGRGSFLPLLLGLSSLEELTLETRNHPLLQLSTLKDYTIETRNPLLLNLSSQKDLTIETNQINVRTELLPLCNTNLKKVTIPSGLIQPLATLFPNITSLTYLHVWGDILTDSDISVLITTVQSLHMLEVLELWTYPTLERMSNDLSELVEAAGNSQLNVLILDSRYYDNLPQHIREQYGHLLKRTY